MDSSALQKFGQQQYQLANYHGALEAFSQAFHLPHKDAIGLLDNRAATYSKLGNLKEALQDGRRMLKADKKDSRGYLRTAKVLQLMEKFDSSLQTYQYALRALPAENAGRKQIELLEAKLDRRLNGPKLIDPFTMLPLEIASMILAYLDLLSLAKMQLVCKRWGDLTSSLPQLWETLDLSMARRQLSLTGMRGLVRKSHSSLKNLILANVVPSHTGSVMSLLRQCKKLSHLDVRLTVDPMVFHTFPKLTTLITQAELAMRLPHLTQILNRCPHLERVDVSLRFTSLEEYEKFPSKLENLRSLTINTIRSRPEGCTLPPLEMPLFHDGTISDRLPHLEELYFVDLSWVITDLVPRTPQISNSTSLQRFGLLGLRLNELPDLPKSLEHISLSRSTVLHIDPAKNPLLDLPNLKSAVLHNFIVPDVSFWESFLSQPTTSSWTALDLERSKPLYGGILKDMILSGHFRSITDFNIAGIAEVDDRLTPVIIEHMPNLRVLDVSMTKITGITLKKLVDSKLEIEKIAARKLEMPLSRDAIQYAQKRGVQVVRSLSRAIEGKMSEPRR